MSVVAFHQVTRTSGRRSARIITVQRRFQHIGQTLHVSFLDAQVARPRALENKTKRVRNRRLHQQLACLYCITEC